MKNFLLKLARLILNVPRILKRIIVMIVDSSLCVLSVWLAYYLRLGEFISLSDNALIAILFSIGLALPIFILFGLYRAIFRYSGWPALLTVSRASLLYGLIYASILTAYGISGVPRTIGIIQPILLLLFVGASRALARLWFGQEYQLGLMQGSPRIALIYGAGFAGRQLAAALAGNTEIRLIGFLDDDQRLHGQVLNGQKIYRPSDLAGLVSSAHITDILLAVPKVSRKRRNEILTQIQSAHVAVRTLPSLNDLVQGKLDVSDLLELDIDDLLARDPVLPNYSLLLENNFDKVVMVTGAGGSIGSELCRQIMSLKPSKLVMIEQSEYALYKIQEELWIKYPNCQSQIIALLASVRDEETIGKIVTSWKPDTIYHAAAYKHVPLVEHNIAEGIKNNVLGTLILAQSAIQNTVSNFVLVSTDKAVRPTNIMGASKRLAEMILQALSETNPITKFSMVRFGNVLGSSGSVVPKFRQQIKDGGPVTLTHLDITRFFMTIPEASQLVLQAGAMARGGEIFILDMGQPIKIIDLAKRMVELSGLTIKDERCPWGNIEIQITGLRPGEKLYEELLIGSNSWPTEHPRILKAQEEYILWRDLQEKLNSLFMALKENDAKVIKSIIEILVSGYRSKSDIVDWNYLGR